MVSKVGLTTADDSFSVAHLLPEAQGCSTIAENTHFPDTAGIPSLHPVTTFLFSLLSPFFRAVKVNSGVCGERGTAGRSLRLKRFQKKMLLYAFLIGTGKKKSPLSRVNGSPLIPYWSVSLPGGRPQLKCPDQHQRGVWTTVTHCPGGFLIHRVTLQELLWLLSILPPWTKIVPVNT